MIALLLSSALALGRAPAPEPVVWPPPPDPPRVRALDEIVTSDWARMPPEKRGFSTRRPRANAIGFKKPYGVAANAQGLVYVSDTGWGRVLRFDPTGRTFRWVGESGQGALSKPAGLALDGRDHLFVADLSLASVYEYDPEGKFVRSWGGDDVTRPVGVAWNPLNNTLWVTDSRDHQLELYDLTTGERRTVGSRGSEPGLFNFPTNIAAGADGRMYVMDTFNFRVQVFDQNGVFERSWGRNCDGFGCFAKPKGIGVAPDGRVFVADTAFSNVQVFGPEGELLLAFGGVGNGPGRLYMPAGLTITSNSLVYVVSQYSWRVNVYEYLGDRQ
jgi:DNA-binding beta-propeller fold protein YncE